MAAVNSAKSFLKILEKSGIIEESKLKSALSQLSKKYKGQMVKLDDLTQYLIDQELITEWHREKLLAGRYKGFYLGKYKLLRHLGSGGMSTVYLAAHRISGQLRAIKVLPKSKVEDKSYLDRFYREGKAAASLNHPNIVRIYDICNEDDRHFMVMEYVEGKDLYELVKANGPADPRDAANYIIQAAAGLQHAHDRNLVHRDIKPANLLRADGGSLKILDLGLALFQENEEESLTVMHGERVMGTADYLSPEQAIDSHDIDHRSDIYSLGCTLYYLLTGQPPFPTGSLAQRIAKHRTEYPTAIDELRLDCPEPLIRVCEKMYRKKPENRFHSCVEVAESLQQFLDTGNVDLERPASSDILDQSGAAQLQANLNQFPEIAIDTSRSSKKLSPGSRKPGSRRLSASHSEKSQPLMPVWAMITIILMSLTAVVLSVLVARKLMAKNEIRVKTVPRVAYNCLQYDSKSQQAGDGVDWTTITLAEPPIV